MSLSFTATGATKYVPGPYLAHLVKIEKKFKLVEKEDGAKEDRPYLRWIFELDKEGYEGQSLSVLSGTSFGFDTSGHPAKARRFAEAILGRPLDLGENFSDADLYDKPVVLHVDNEKTSRGTFAKVTEITAATEENLDDIPF
jgi:hypothetical protein